MLWVPAGESQGEQWPRLYPAVRDADNLRRARVAQETGNRPSFDGLRTEPWLYVRNAFYLWGPCRAVGLMRLPRILRFL